MRGLHRYGTTPTDRALLELVQASMQGKDVRHAAHELGLNVVDRAELYDSLAFVLRLVFGAIGGSINQAPSEVAANVTQAVEWLLDARPEPKRGAALRLMN